MEGDFVGVYQDVLLDITESPTEDGLLEEEHIQINNAETEVKLNANKPFMYMIKMDHELLGLGRITVFELSLIKIIAGVMQGKK